MSGHQHRAGDSTRRGSASSDLETSDRGPGMVRQGLKKEVTEEGESADWGHGAANSGVAWVTAWRIQE